MANNPSEVEQMQTESLADQQKLAMSSVSHTSISSQQSSYTDDNKEKNNKRMKLLKSAFDKAVQKCTSSVKFSLFAKGYAEVHRKQKSALEAIHKDYQDQFHRSMTQEMELMIEEENLESLLGDLSTIISQTPVDQNPPEWRPQGDPTRDVSAHLMPVKLKQCEKLQRLLNNLEADNKKMEAALLPCRRQLLETQKEIQKTRNELEKAAQCLHSKELVDVLKL